MQTCISQTNHHLLLQKPCKTCTNHTNVECKTMWDTAQTLPIVSEEEIKPFGQQVKEKKSKDTGNLREFKFQCSLKRYVDKKLLQESWDQEQLCVFIFSPNSVTIHSQETKNRGKFEKSNLHSMKFAGSIKTQKSVTPLTTWRIPAMNRGVPPQQRQERKEAFSIAPHIIFITSMAHSFSLQSQSFQFSFPSHPFPSFSCTSHCRFPQYWEDIWLKILPIFSILLRYLPPHLAVLEREAYRSTLNPHLSLGSKLMSNYQNTLSSY